MGSNAITSYRKGNTMYIKMVHKLFIICLNVFLVACSSPKPFNNFTTSTPSNDSSNQISLTNTPQSVPLTSGPIKEHPTAIFPTITPTLEPIAEQLTAIPPTITPNNNTDSMNSATTNILHNCPTLVDSNLQLSAGGSILFSTGQISNPPSIAFAFLPEQSGVWSISTAKDEPILVYDIPTGQDSFVYVSNDGLKLAYFNDDLKNLIREGIFFNIETNDEVKFPLPWSKLPPSWLQDGRFKYTTSIEHIKDVGIKSEGLIIDPFKQQIESFSEELDLPNYYFYLDYIEKGYSSGYASVSPDGDLVLYTASREGSGVDIILKDIQNNIVIWQEGSFGLPERIEPVWSADSSRVLFVIFEHKTNYAGHFDKIISLTRDGHIEEFPPQPYGLAIRESINFLTRSPNNQYIIFRLDPFSGTSYILDLASKEITEICEPDATFIDGFWLSNEQFIYRVLIKRGGEQKHSLRLLDIPTWTTQILYEPSANYGVNIFGWSSVEFP